jgi:hypothetical protein
LVYLESFATFRDWGLGEGARRRIGGGLTRTCTPILSQTPKPETSNLAPNLDLDLNVDPAPVAA